MTYVLGLDMGVTSIGWCLVNESSKQIITAGSRIFQAGVNIQPTGKEVSKNAKRRLARQTRRQIFRKHERRDLLKKVLQCLDWLPKEDPLFEKIMNKKPSPYILRQKGLDEGLTLYELGRVLYHLSKRRGFKSSRKSGGDTDESVLFRGNEDKVGILDLEKEMIKTDSRTVGEYFAKIEKNEVQADIQGKELRIRSRFVLRQMYLNEFNEIWESQLKFHPEIQKPITYEYVVRNCCSKKYHDKWIKQDLHAFLKDFVMYYQRPLKSQKSLVGDCTLETKSKKAPMSSLLFQEFRIWDKLHSIRIIGDDRNDSPLSFEEKQIAFTKLNASKEQTIEQLLKLLKLENYSTNYKNDDRVKGNTTAHALGLVFGKNQWDGLDDIEKEKRWKIIYDAEDNDFLIQYGISKWGLSEAVATKLTSIKLETQYGKISQKAIKKILPLMAEKNMDYASACKEKGYNDSQNNGQNKSIDIHLDEGKVPKLRNPIVEQSLFELRKVVNTLIEEYDIKPTIIRIELARELKMPKKKREAILSDNKAKERENNRITNILREEYGRKNSGADDILKYKLWEECNHKCPYTGDNINGNALFNGQYEIEHIIPFRRSLDDSFQNKTLCHIYFNKIKGQLTPYEMDRTGKIIEFNRIYGYNITYEDVLTRAKALKHRGQLNYKKYKKFMQQTVNSDMVTQQLNDTAYLSREAKAYLETICKKVQVSKGGATATLRHFWGLNKLLNKFDLNIKNRDDHRHHALDAIVVAFTTPSTLNDISFLHEKEIRPNPRLFPKPWPDFRDSVEIALNDILIAHRKKQRARGQLHDETLYGQVNTTEGAQKIDEKGLPYFTIRKSVKDLTPAMIMKVAEPARSIILERLKEFGIDITANKIKEIPKGAFDEMLWMPNKKEPTKPIPIKRVRVHDVASNKIEIRRTQKIKNGVFVDPGNNHHIVIFKKPNGKLDGEVVSLFKAVQRQKDKNPIINTEIAPNEFVMSLAINDMVLIDTDTFKTATIDWNLITKKELSEHLYRVQKMDINQIITFRHHLVSILKDEDGKEPGRFFSKPSTFKGIKVIVNAIGEIRKA